MLFLMHFILWLVYAPAVEDTGNYGDGPGDFDGLA